MKKVLLEICCGSADDVIEAYRAGADRVELNSDLFHGGLTPTVGSLTVAKRETGLKIMAMVRPREGGLLLHGHGVCHRRGGRQTAAVPRGGRAGVRVPP